MGDSSENTENIEVNSQHFISNFGTFYFWMHKLHENKASMMNLIQIYNFKAISMCSAIIS